MFNTMWTKLFPKKKFSIQALSRQRPVIQSNMTAESIKRGVQERARQLNDPKLASEKLEEELKHYKK